LLSNALEAVGNRGLSFMPWEEEHKTTLHAMLGSAPSAPPPDPLRSRSRQEAILAARRPFSINLFLGPEGGFTAGEVAIARHYGVIPITLGARSLRADTAGVVAASIILHEMGDMT
jgi:16S rRNA U1498 N3-methylase RsmE